MSGAVALYANTCMNMLQFCGYEGATCSVSIRPCVTSYTGFLRFDFDGAKVVTEDQRLLYCEIKQSMPECLWLTLVL